MSAPVSRKWRWEHRSRRRLLSAQLAAQPQRQDDRPFAQTSGSLRYGPFLRSGGFFDRQQGRAVGKAGEKTLEFRPQPLPLIAGQGRDGDVEQDGGIAEAIAIAGHELHWPDHRPGFAVRVGIGCHRVVECRSGFTQAMVNSDQFMPIRPSADLRCPVPVRWHRLPREGCSCRYRTGDTRNRPFLHGP